MNQISELENLCGPNKPLSREAPDPTEIDGLIQSGRLRLRDSKNETLSLESRFDLAYNASHALSLAALRKAGYRSSNRYIVFQLLQHTLGLGPEVWRVLSKCHDLRNRAEYGGEFGANNRLLRDLIDATEQALNALEN
ncbi:MAG: hypothetical protein RJA17_1485 [Pseudomonadota bacterium]|jgi:hypothetical protein